MSFPFQESLALADHLLAACFAFLFAAAAACVAGGSVFMLAAEFHGRESMDPRWDALARRCARLARASAAWGACPSGAALWVLAMARQPRMMEQLHAIFIVPALLGLSAFFLGFCFLNLYLSSWGTGRGERPLHFSWGVLSALCFWCAAAALASIRAFSINTGAWTAQPGLWRAFWNPSFLPTLAAWAAVSALAFGALGWLYAATQKDVAWRAALVSRLGGWMAAASAAGVLALIWWGARLPEESAGGPSLRLMAAAGAAQAALGALGYFRGVRRPEGRQGALAGAACVLAVLLMTAFGWVLVEARGNFWIHRYMYRNGIIVEEAEALGRSGLWRFENPGRPLPDKERLGAFSFRVQCMACHEDWVKPADASRAPGFRLEGEALRFLESMGARHPWYPLFAGAPEERRAMASYLEGLIAKSGRALAPRPEAAGGLAGASAGEPEAPGAASSAPPAGAREAEKSKAKESP